MDWDFWREMMQSFASGIVFGWLAWQVYDEARHR